MRRSPKFHQSPRVDVLTEIEARTLEAIGRGEDPTERVGEEFRRVTAGRRRAVTGLRAKGFVENAVRDLFAAPQLTEKGRRFLAGRADTEPPIDAHEEAPC